MRRRNLLRYASAGFLSTLGLGLASSLQSYQAQNQTQNQAQSGSLSVQTLGHTAFLFTGGGRRILVNPFRQIGCTEGYAAPAAAADLVLISSSLFDEGYLADNYTSAQVIDQPGIYEIRGLNIQGISMPHDREGGRRFGMNIAWVWNQAGVKIAHLGGAAAPISLEDKILIGRPDVLLVPVGGGPKAYTPQEAVEAVRSLNPKLIIPTHYRTQAADGDACDIVAVDEFLTLMQGTSVNRTTGTLSVSPSGLPSDGMSIAVLNYPF